MVLCRCGFKANRLKVELVETFHDDIVRNFQLAAVNQNLTLWEHASWNKSLFLLLLLLSGRCLVFRMNVQ